jgi:hypothetical protein
MSVLTKGKVEGTNNIFEYYQSSAQGRLGDDEEDVSGVHDMFHDMFVYKSGMLRYDMFVSVQGTKKPTKPNQTICFTICLFISPDLDGHKPNERSR